VGCGGKANRLGGLFAENSRRQARASFFVKIVLLAGGAAIAGAAQGVELAHSAGGFSGWTLIGFAGIALVAIGSVFVVIVEADPTAALEEARQALEEARFREEEINRFNTDTARLKKEIRRGLELYNSMFVMRTSIQQFLDVGNLGSSEIIQTCLAAATNSLLVAFDFAADDTWTICVFAPRQPSESGNAILKCVAQARKINCDIEQAREWPAGVGVAGICYSTGNEIIIPDMAAPELGSTFTLGTNARSYDAERYRSMVAVPVRMGSDEIPWGVAVASSNKRHHFTDEPADGVSTCEPIRAIAAMAALAVKTVDAGERISPPATRRSRPRREATATPRAADGRADDTVLPNNE
jgi:hypothetical protein